MKVPTKAVLGGGWVLNQILIKNTKMHLYYLKIKRGVQINEKHKNYNNNNNKKLGPNFTLGTEKVHNSLRSMATVPFGPGT